MAAQKGKDLLLKIETETADTYTTVAGLRSRTIAFNAEAVDVTDQESSGEWRELLSGAGVKTARISGSGIFRDAASDSLVREHVFYGTIPSCQIVVPDFGTVTGLFQISSFELSGRHDGEVSFEIGLESAGALTFAAAA